ncbi:hypothetical protein [Prosthecochloris sp. GSB1]|uniref:hypothetical protein n=1 Tax=Prosthecochloris sp. GSB1 TaxID=281093 RepID=UPI0012374663|nr:hypothetical protein [Prosthecochloris sp. GSB1]
MRTLLAVSVMISGLFLVSGCRVSRDLASEAVGLNMAVEETENKLLLLNIVRASRHQPMYFTGFSKLSGSSGVTEGSLGLAIPFGADATRAYSVSPGLKLGPNVNYDIGILQTHEFMRGILMPLAPETVKYYWDQGWPKKLLLHLFVEEIAVMERKNNEDRVTRRFSNAPDTGDSDGLVEFNNFTAEIDRLVDTCEVQLLYRDVPAREAVNDGGTARMPGSVVFSTKQECRESSAKGYSLKFQSESAGACEEEGPFAVVYLRSPQSVIYYLGEIVRAQTKGGIPVGEYPAWPFFYKNGKDRENDRKRPIIYVTKARKRNRRDAYVSIRYDGETYVIPKRISETESNDRSMQTLALVMQLIGQYKFSEDLPTTPALRIIGN